MDESTSVDTIDSRRKLLKQVRASVRAYKFNTKKHKLLETQAKVKLTLKQMGVANRQIPITIIPSRAQTIKVRVT